MEDRDWRRLPILVVDPEDEITQQVENALASRTEDRWRLFRIERVNDADTAQKRLVRGMPKYAAIIYESSQVKGHASSIAEARRKDSYMPQIIIGNPATETSGLDLDALMQAVRAGVTEYAKGIEGLEEVAGRIFKIKNPLPQPATVVKIGGSAFDYARQVSGNMALKDVADALIGMHKPVTRTGNAKRGRTHRIICTAGAGQLGDVAKEHFRTYKDEVPFAHDLHPELMAETLATNLKMLYGLFGEANSNLVNTGAFYFITDKSTRRKIPLIGIAPHYILVRDEIPLEDSDTNTIALAEYLGVSEVILIKRTDGIYSFDPMRGFRSDPLTGKCGDYLRWRETQAKNRLHKVVSVENMLFADINREGTGINGLPDETPDHLMEDSALKYLANSEIVKKISVVHIAPEEMYVQTSRGLEHIVTGKIAGEDTPLSVKDALAAAIGGKAQSIIRNYRAEEAAALQQFL